eukprot:scaffold477035_cov32-Prasinocladus_malaysianus.AAC.1
MSGLFMCGVGERLGGQLERHVTKEFGLRRMNACVHTGSCLSQVGVHGLCGRPLTSLAVRIAIEWTAFCSSLLPVCSWRYEQFNNGMAGHTQAYPPPCLSLPEHMARV